MKRIRQIFRMVTVLLAALSAVSCQDPTLGQDSAELMVSLYIPDAVLTKAETGMVNPLEAEKQVHSLQIWVFLNTGTEDNGALVSYNHFNIGLSDSGLPNSAVTRFAMPLTNPMFKRLCVSGTQVDVYAVANMPPGTTVFLHPESEGGSLSTTTLGSSTIRSELERVVLTGDSFGATPLTTSFPDGGLPMSGVLKGASISGGYPVLNVLNNSNFPSLTLTRAVSKIRFVFCQQANPPTASDPTLVPFNSNCEIKRISFDGGEHCEIADQEFLFTTNKHPESQDLFAVSGYSLLSAEITGAGGASLIPNEDLTCSEYPESFVYGSAGHEAESAQQYETRLDEAISSTSQVGPIYLRETDHNISGTITYNTGGEDQEATFSLWDENNHDFLTRNHSWIVYAYFSEETKTLQLTVRVKPWDWSEHRIDFTGGSVNVIRRFTVQEKPPLTFKKEETDAGNGFYDITFWHTATIVNDDDEHTTSTITNNSVTGDIIIATPVGATLCAIAVPGALDGYEIFSPRIDGEYVPVFEVSPLSAMIYPNYLNMASGKIEDCMISFTVRCNHRLTDGTYDDQLKGQYIDLHFCVKVGDDLYIDLGSESIDYYRFILDPDWNISQNSSNGDD